MKKKKQFENTKLDYLFCTLCHHLIETIKKEMVGQQNRTKTYHIHKDTSESFNHAHQPRVNHALMLQFQLLRTMVAHRYPFAVFVHFFHTLQHGLQTQTHSSWGGKRGLEI